MNYVQRDLVHSILVFTDYFQFLFFFLNSIYSNIMPPQLLNDYCVEFAHLKEL